MTTRRRLRDAAVLAAVAAAFGGSLVMFRDAVGFASPWFGLMVMLDVLGLVAFARPLFLLGLPGFLRTLHGWEARGALYRALGVPGFGVLLRRTPLRSLNPMVYLGPDSEGPVAVLAQLESAEAAHYLAAVVLSPYVVHAYLQGSWSAAAWLMAVQIGFNLYPIMHLRWARVRLGRVLLPHRVRR